MKPNVYHKTIFLFRIECEPNDEVVGTGDIMVTNEKETSAVLTGLQTGNKYNVSVIALRGNEIGYPATKTFTTALPPPR